jgi:UDP-N-acetylmuramoyl-tripeptide--D-alanyl-D-alanine ligase
VVKDTLRGLQDAAAAYLKKFPRLFRVGITGSSGKTSNMEIGAAIIGRERPVVLNRGNINSETGLPLSVFKVRQEHEVGIFECGMNRPGEIVELARVLNPHVALITGIGTAHIGMIGSRDRISLEKKMIFSQFSGNEIAIIPEADDYRDFLLGGVDGKIVFFGPECFKELGEVKDLGLEGTEIVWDGKPVRFALPGKFNFQNALAAIAIAREVPVSNNAIREGLEAVKPLFGRSEILHGDLTVIRDCYNANPESTAAALDFCDNLDWPGRKIYVLGSMLELGENSRQAHEGIGRLLAASPADKVFFFGADTKPAAALVKNSFYTENKEELSHALKEYVREGDLVLLKGSRGCALESLSETLVKGVR